MPSSANASQALPISEANVSKTNSSTLQTALTVIRWICFLLYPYLLTVLVNCTASYDSSVLSFLLENRPGAFYFGLFVTYALFIALCLICLRPWLAGSVLGLCCTALAFADYFKFSFLQEHLFPWDLLLAKSMGEFKPFLAEVHITPMMILLFFSPLNLQHTAFAQKTQMEICLFYSCYHRSCSFCRHCSIFDQQYHSYALYRLVFHFCQRYLLTGKQLPQKWFFDSICA